MRIADENKELSSAQIGLLNKFFKSDEFRRSSEEAAAKEHAKRELDELHEKYRSEKTAASTALAELRKARDSAQAVLSEAERKLGIAAANFDVTRYTFMARKAELDKIINGRRERVVIESQ